MRILCITPIENINGIWNRLENIGRIIYRPDSDRNQVIRDLKYENPNIIFTNPNRQNFKLDRSVLEKSNIKVICTASTGTNHIDKKYCKEAGIEIICIAKERKTLDTITSTAEEAFTLMMIALRNMNTAINFESWDCEPYIGRQVNKLKIGIVGYGRLGTIMTRFCQAFGATVYVYDPYVPVTSPLLQTKYLEILLKICDVVSLHVHVTDETTHMINTESLKYANPNLVLINTSRGEIVNEKDLSLFLKTNPNSKYATDVLENEFDDWNDSPLLNSEYQLYKDGSNQVIITPHIGGMTHDAREIAYNRAIDLLELKLEEDNVI